MKCVTKLGIKKKGKVMKESKKERICYLNWPSPKGTFKNPSIIDFFYMSKFNLSVFGVGLRAFSFMAI